MTEETMAGREYLGRGWAFPVRWNPVRADGVEGAVDLSEGETDVREAILLILKTAAGARLLHPEFGTGIDRYVFAPRTADTAFRLQTEVERALIRWEPRAIIDKVEARPSPDDEGRIDVFIEYRVETHRHPQSLVYPFYVIAEESAT